MKSAVRQSNENQIEIPDDEIPTTNEGREKYFMNHLQLGEQLMVQGMIVCLLGNFSRLSHCSRNAAGASIACKLYFISEFELTLGPPAYDAASTCFYRALQVYPEPQKLLEVLSQSLPEIIISMIIQKMAAEVQSQSHTHANVEEVE